MHQRKSTRVVLREDLPTAITSSRIRANLDTVGFNIGFLLRRRPLLAIEILKLYDQAFSVREEDPDAADEDTRQAVEEWRRFAGEVSDNLS
jgi:hypothetical protein